MSIEIISQKISHGNIEWWAKRTREFLATNPACLCCGDPLMSFSRTGLCWRCRVRKNYLAFLDRNPGYTKRYQQERGNNESK